MNYDTNNWNYLIYTLRFEDNFGGIPEINRAQIIDDLLILARANYVEYDIAFRATKYLIKEKNHLPWRSFLNNVQFLIERFDGNQKISSSLKEYVLKLIEPIYEELGFEDKANDTDLDKLNRQFILFWTCRLGHTRCIKKAKQIFDAWRGNGSY